MDGKKQLIILVCVCLYKIVAKREWGNLIKNIFTYF